MTKRNFFIFASLVGLFSHDGTAQISCFPSCSGGGGGSGVTSVTATAPLSITGTSSAPNVTATYQGGGAKIQKSTGSTTSGDSVSYDVNGNVVDAGFLSSNIILSTGSYSNPGWLASLAYSKVTGAPSFPTSASLLGTNSSAQPTAVTVGSGLSLSGGTLSATSGGGSSILSGAYSLLPSTCQNSKTYEDAYFPTNSYYTFLCTAENTWSPFLDGKQVYLPAASSSWTKVNGASGTATPTDSAGAVVFSTTSDVLGLEAMLQAVPATPYTKTIGFRAYATTVSATSDVIECGMVLSNGVTTSSAASIFGFDFDQTHSRFPSLEIDAWSNFTGAGGSGPLTRPLGTGVFTGANSTIWLQFSDDGTTNKTYRVSQDGVNFTQVYQVSRTSAFTPSYYGIGCFPVAGSGVPWSLTLLSDH